MNNRRPVTLVILACALSMLGACTKKESKPQKVNLDVQPKLGLPASAEGKVQIFVLAGQSNMSGRGELSEYKNQLSDQIFVYGNDNQWKQAYEPIDDATGQVDQVSADDIAGVSMAMAFAQNVVKDKPDMIIGLVPCAKGGTVIRQWKKASGRDSLYGSCLYRTKEALKSGQLAAILFHQGESDAWDPVEYASVGPVTTEWTAMFQQFVSDFRNDLGQQQAPVIFAQIGTHRDAKMFVNWEAVKEQQGKTTIENGVMVTTSDLPLKDYVHYTTSAYQTLGQRYAEAYLTNFAK